MKKKADWKEFYMTMVRLVDGIVQISLLLLGLWLIFFERRYIEGSLICIAQSVWGIENILLDHFRKEDNEHN